MHIVTILIQFPFNRNVNSIKKKEKQKKKKKKPRKWNSKKRVKMEETKIDYPLKHLNRLTVKMCGGEYCDGNNIQIKSRSE